MMPYPRIRLGLLSAACVAGLVTTAAAQSGASGTGTGGAPPAAGNEKPDSPATRPSPQRDGTAPGNEGSTGWTGGTGGAFTGTTSQSPTPASPSPQPETAKGLAPGPSAPTGPASR